MTEMTTDTQTATAADLSTARRVASQFAAEVRRRFGDRVGAIRLFGSAARGDWTGESDIDVLVVVRDAAIGDEVSLLAFRLGVMTAGILLKPLMLTQGQFDELLARERRIVLDIEREGIDL